MTDQTTQPPSQPDQSSDQETTDQTKSGPYAFYVAALTLGLTTLIALSAMLIFRDLFENATDVTTVLGSLFAVVGTVVGAYFGIKTSGDTRDKMQGTLDRAHETANRALAELDPGTARRVMGEQGRTNS